MIIMASFPNSKNVNDLMFCQFINESDNDKSSTDAHTNENLVTNEGSTTTTDINESTITTTTTTNEERIPNRMRRKTTTASAIHGVRKKSKNPKKPFIPLPPPTSSSSFSTSYGGGAANGALPTTLLVDPSMGGSFHPDFMFCGNCTDCQEEEEKEEGDSNNPTETAVVKNSNGIGYSIDSNTDSDSDSSDSTDSSDNKKGFLQTTFQLQQRTNQDNNDMHNDTLVLRSLIRAIPGVRKVSIPNNIQQQQQTQTHNNDSNSERIIIIHHDASVHTKIVLHALESAGHSAFVRDNDTTTTSNAVITTNVSVNESNHNNHNNEPNQNQKCWVRSSFNVQGVCCASEIPAVRKIVRPLWGVGKVNINLTTKVVHVQHNYIQIQASQIAQKLTEQGFPAHIYKDGAATVQGQIQLFDNSNNNRSGNNNKEEEEKYYSNAIADILDRIGQSPYVESTLCVKGLRPDQVNRIKKSIADSFISIQVRAVYPNATSETVKVEHNPELVSIKEIRDFLRQYATDKDASFPPTAKVYIDGADANLYLPAKEDYPNHQPINNDSANGGCLFWMMNHHVNVWLSGFFWVLSMVSIVNGIDWFKYFGLASVLFGLPPIIIKAYRTLKRCQFDANCMMVTAALGALALGQYDEAASVSFLFAVSEFLEASATTKARKALSEICALRPDHANVIHPISKEIVVVPADRVPLGSLISVRTGDKIAADGVVVEGSTAIDESSLTGESTPAHKIVGDEVSGGTINIGQTQLVVKTTTTVEDSAVSRLIRLVEEAQSNRSPTEKMVDAFAQSYTPFVIFIASLMCTIPWAFGTDIGRHWTLNGLILVVIACPCALTISTPVTYAAGLAATAKRGVIIKGGAKLEAMGSVDRVVFDKTGTLTKGKFSVTHLEVISSSKTRQEMLELLSLMQERASHPIASSLVQAVKAEGVNVPRQMSVTDHQILKGEGIMAKIDGKIQVYVGNQRLFNRLGMLELLSPVNKNLVEEWGDSGGTLGFIGSREDGIIGMFCVKDSVREEAREAIDELKEAGIEAWICTGDSDATAQAVAKEIGIPEHCVNSQLLPEDKLQFVKGLKRPRPKRFALCCEKRYVLFCGDGVNDAPALAAAEIGVSMGEGAAMALEMSDVTLMDSRLTKLTYAIRMGQRVLRTVKENIIISFVAKLLIIVLTFMGKMTLLYAIAADVGVMLLVTLNGMKLLPNTSFDLVSPRRSRRGRAIIKQRVGIGTNTDFELVRMKTSRSCSDDSIDSFEPDVSEII